MSNGNITVVKDTQMHVRHNQNNYGIEMITVQDDGNIHIQTVRKPKRRRRDVPVMVNSEKNSIEFLGVKGGKPFVRLIGEDTKNLSKVFTGNNKSKEWTVTFTEEPLPKS